MELPVAASCTSATRPKIRTRRRFVTALPLPSSAHPIQRFARRNVTPIPIMPRPRTTKLRSSSKKRTRKTRRGARGRRWSAHGQRLQAAQERIEPESEQEEVREGDAVHEPIGLREARHRDRDRDRDERRRRRPAPSRREAAYPRSRDDDASQDDREPPRLGGAPTARVRAAWIRRKDPRREQRHRAEEERRDRRSRVAPFVATESRTSTAQATSAGTTRPVACSPTSSPAPIVDAAPVANESTRVRVACGVRNRATTVRGRRSAPSATNESPRSRVVATHRQVQEQRPEEVADTREPKRYGTGSASTSHARTRSANSPPR